MDQNKLFGAVRSTKWPAVRRKFLIGKSCGVCGGVKKLEAHHINPFHLRPDLELNTRNLYPLCEGNKNINCHLIFGHFGNYRTKFNLMIDRDALFFKERLTAKSIDNPML